MPPRPAGGIDPVYAFRAFAMTLMVRHGVRRFAEVTPELVRSFVLSSASGQQSPSISTMHFRRSSIRILFAEARRLGLADRQLDPSIDLGLPPRSGLRQRPLTNEEIVTCRIRATDTKADTRQPASWALAEATARTSELPHIVAADLDLAAHRVWIHGGSKTDSRWGSLSAWGVNQLCHRLEGLSARPEGWPIVYEGRGSLESQQASSCAAIAQILRRGGLADEPDVGPGSVAAWAGARALSDGMSIDQVARTLGVRRLDQAVRLVGWRWDTIQETAEPVNNFETTPRRNY